MLFADHAHTIPSLGGRDALLAILGELPAGLTEVTLHPAVDTPELRAAASADWASRTGDLALLVDDPGVAAAVEASGATLIGYRPLHDAMRSSAGT